MPAPKVVFACWTYQVLRFAVMGLIPVGDGTERWQAVSVWLGGRWCSAAAGNSPVHDERLRGRVSALAQGIQEARETLCG